MRHEASNGAWRAGRRGTVGDALGLLAHLTGVNMLVVCWGVVHALASDMAATMEAAERRLASGLAETTLEELVLLAWGT